MSLSFHSVKILKTSHFLCSNVIPLYFDSTISFSLNYEQYDFLGFSGRWDLHESRRWNRILCSLLVGWFSNQSKWISWIARKGTRFQKRTWATAWHSLTSYCPTFVQYLCAQRLNWFWYDKICSYSIISRIDLICYSGCSFIYWNIQTFLLFSKKTHIFLKKIFLYYLRPLWRIN